MLSSSFDLLSIGALPALVKDYLQGQATVKKFYQYQPNIESIIQAAGERNFANREVLVDALIKQNSPYSNSSLIRSLADENTFTVTTGHQLCAATGPLYFLYKIASTIALANQLSQADKSHRYIPVYWMASEDHDFEEIQSIEIFQKKITWQNASKGPVGRFNLEGMPQFISELEEILGNGDDAKKWINILKESYATSSWSDATRRLVYALFGEEQLIVIDADDAALKKCFLPIVKKEISERFSMELVKTTSAELEALGYKAQVSPREINLFFIRDGIRERLKFENGLIHWGEGSKTVEETSMLAELNPECFSPNVILRPIYQETILPNLAYVGGPGELSYWLQLKSVFQSYNVFFPVLLLRDSALLVSPSVNSRLQKLQLSLDDVFSGKANIIQRWIDALGQEDLTKEKNESDRLFDAIAAKMKALDPTLEASALGEKKKLIVALENLEKKMTKAIKNKEEVRIQQLDKIFSELFPSDQPQERVTNISQYADFLNEGLLDFLIGTFDPTKLNLTVVQK
ncbi:MAG: bacillithiol biosynthesis cysteine-adding enzyme BshC [Flavobacteriales bacterium]|jgi:bacillithiol biosynthesis cysteine-adding enzyme BshC